MGILFKVEKQKFYLIEHRKRKTNKNELFTEGILFYIDNRIIRLVNCTTSLRKAVELHQRYKSTLYIWNLLYIKIRRIELEECRQLTKSEVK